MEGCNWIIYGYLISCLTLNETQHALVTRCSFVMAFASSSFQSCVSVLRYWYKLSDKKPWIIEYDHLEKGNRIIFGFPFLNTSYFQVLICTQPVDLTELSFCHWTTVLSGYIIYHANGDLELQFFDCLSSMTTGNVIDWNATRISLALQYDIISSGLDSWHTWR